MDGQETAKNWMNSSAPFPNDLEEQGTIFIEGDEITEVPMYVTRRTLRMIDELDGAERTPPAACAT